MNKLFYLFLFLCINFYTAYSQGYVYQTVKDEYAKYGAPKIHNDLLLEDTNYRNSEITNLIQGAKFYKINNALASNLIAKNYSVLSIGVKISGTEYVLDLVNSESMFLDANIITTDGDELSVNNIDVVHYKGVIRGEDKSLVALSITPKEVSGFISGSIGNYAVGKIENGTENIIYPDKEITKDLKFSCDTFDESPKSFGYETKTAKNGVSYLDKCVKLSYYTEYDMYTTLGSDTDVLLYMTMVHNQISTLYANENIRTPLSSVVIASSEDPFTGQTSNELLNQFTNYQGTFSGDLAILLSFRTFSSGGKGGLAYVDRLCYPNERYRRAICTINSYYSSVPAYSWTVSAITHEFGHLMGSRHTHDCVWNGNNTAIDGCGPTADIDYQTGSCSIGPIPSDGGTIMSYCHMLGTGINFSKGFGPQPGDLIRSRVQSAPCLSVCECLQDYTILDPVTAEQHFKVAGTLTAKSSISSNINVSFRGEEINLESGFSVGGGSSSGIFTAQILPCNLGTIYHRQANTFNDKTDLLDLNSNTQKVVISPNPTHGIVNINSIQEIKEINIFSIDGKKVFERKFLEGFTDIELNINGYTSGIYLVNVISNTGEIYTQKLIKN